eukprot:TRINITY_DN16558_c0_g1_i1.p1 TRINITY_DN16558_c0_g1~~TRINITY_DN16558_c0_g1_i1.p1  ORF type:complete len:755 (+),score=246.08 TRINITY_DN16558_c0_g1_i1:81-2345(+)
MRCSRAAALLLIAAPAAGAGGQKLWDLGDLVDENPLTTFCMFTLVVVLSVVVEITRHSVEHRTRDYHRRRALEAIYSELMMVGIVSFGLILGAELGLTELRLRKPFCDDDVAGASGSASGSTGNVSNASTAAPAPADPCASSSGSGSTDPCYVGFDLLMFEYAHLVLFFMGLMYCVFIQVALCQLDRYAQDIHDIETKTLGEWIGPKGFKEPSVLGVMGIGCTTASWARSILVLRAAMVLNLRSEIEEAADPDEAMLEYCMADFLGKPLPAPRPSPDEAQVHFSVAKFVRIGSAEVMIDLLHVPVAVWLSIIFIAGGDALRVLGVDIGTMMVVCAFFGPTLALIVLWRMSEHLLVVVRNCIGHPMVYDVEYVNAFGERLTGSVRLQNQNLEERGSRWAKQVEARRAGEPFAEVDHPWSELEGCCPDDHVLNCLDPLDPSALQLQIQVVIFASCFYVGQIMMLSSLILEKLGFAVLLVCWVLPVLALLVFIPRAILIFTLVHKTSNPPRAWLLHAIKVGDDPTEDDHGEPKNPESPRAAGTPWSVKRQDQPGHNPRAEVLARMRDKLAGAAALQDGGRLGEPLLGSSDRAEETNGMERSLNMAASIGPTTGADVLRPSMPLRDEPVAGFRPGDAVVFAGVPQSRHGVRGGTSGLVAATTRQGRLHVVVEGVGLLTDVAPTSLRAATPLSSPPSTPPSVGAGSLASPQLERAVTDAVRKALREPMLPQQSDAANPLLAASTGSPAVVHRDVLSRTH